MSTKREPKTIEEARALLLPAMPEGWTLSLTARFYHVLKPDGQWANIEYSAWLWRGDNVKDAIKVEAGTPAKLVKETLRKLFTFIETFHPELLPAPSRSQRGPRRKQPARLASSTQLKLGYRRA